MTLTLTEEEHALLKLLVAGAHLRNTEKWRKMVATGGPAGLEDAQFYMDREGPFTRLEKKLNGEE